MRLVPESAIYRFPAESNAIPRGPFKVVSAAGALSMNVTAAVCLIVPPPGSAAGLADVACVPGPHVGQGMPTGKKPGALPPVMVAPCTQVPATVVMMPADASTSRIRLLPVCAMWLLLEKVADI